MSTKTQNRAITYSLLAHINSSRTISGGPLDIFAPLVKKALHVFLAERKNTGAESLSELAEVISELYGINMPTPVLSTILRRIAQEINEPERRLTVYSDGSFHIKQFSFEDYDEEISRCHDSYKQLENKFNNFCYLFGYAERPYSPVVDLIEKNRASVSRYLTHETDDIQSSDVIAAEFINYCKKDPVSYDQLRNLYLGSMLTCYLGYNPSEARMSVTLLLDTNFVVSLLDLNTPESTMTCRMLLDVCRNLGYTFHVMSYTIDEIRALFSAKASTFESNYLSKAIYKEDILNACSRRKLNAADLLRVSDNLENSLGSYGISIIKDLSKQRNKAKFSKEYEQFRTIRRSQSAALHDALAIQYVRDYRGGKRIQRFEDVNCWFVNNTISHYEDEKHRDSLVFSSDNSYQPEFIKADDLLSIIWLSSPGIDIEQANSIAEIGLTSLAAYTISQSLPRKRVIRELEENIEKYSKEDLTDRDIVLLSSRIASRQIDDIEGLNALANTDSTRFNSSLTSEIDKEIQRQEAIQEHYQKMEADIQKVKNTLESTIQGSEQQLKEKEEAILKLNKEKTELEDNSTKRILESENKYKAEQEKSHQLQSTIIAENERRQLQKGKYIDKKLKKWQNRPILGIVIFLLVLVGGVLWMIRTGFIGEDQAFNNSVIIPVLISLASLFLDGYLIKLLFERKNNPELIEYFKKNLCIPEEFLPLE